jgi:C-terminal processing protease CtpA/Prc
MAQAFQCRFMRTRGQNEGTGSNAETFAYYFRKAGLGQLIGARTWGGVIGSAGSPTFIDGGAVSIPHHAFMDGKANIEGHGVEPDLNVTSASQFTAAIEHLRQKLNH